MSEKIEQWAASDVTPSISSALPAWVIKILKAPLHNQYTHLIWKPFFFFFFCLRDLLIFELSSLFIKSLLLVHLPHNLHLFEKETPHTYNLLLHFKIKKSRVFFSPCPCGCIIVTLVHS